MFERMKFVEAHQSGLYTMTELCERFGVSRRIGYKWLARFEEGGAIALTDRSRRPHDSPLRTSEDVEKVLVKEKNAHPDWGPWKLVSTLRSQYPERRWPAPSTAGDILARHGLVEHRPPRRRHRHPGSSPLQATDPNDVWTADFKGEFRLGNGQYCFPLTAADAASRFLLACDGFAAPQLRPTMHSFERLFRTYGLPRAIRTDNGAPFVTQAIHGLSRLNVYWMKLGIVHQRSRPGCPQDNPRHERMHRTLKQETARPPGMNILQQQDRFDRFLGALPRGEAVTYEPRDCGNIRVARIPAVQRFGQMASRVHGAREPDRRGNIESMMTRRQAWNRIALTTALVVLAACAPASTVKPTTAGEPATAAAPLSTATDSAWQTSRMRSSLRRPRRSTRTPMDTLATESRLTALTRGTGSTSGSSSTSLGSPRIVVVHGAMRVRPSRGMATSRLRTTTGRRPTSGSSHHHSSPR